MSKYQPKIKESFYYPALDSLTKYQEDVWYGNIKQMEMFERGIINPTKESAINQCDSFINLNNKKI